MQPDRATAELGTFTRRTMTVIGLTLLAVLTVVLVWYLADVLLLIFAGVLFAVFLSSLSRRLSSVTRIRYGIALAIVSITLLALFIGGFVLLATQIAQQLTELNTQLTESVTKLHEYLQNQTWGQQLLDGLPDPKEFLNGQNGVVSRVTRMFFSAFGALGSMIIIIFVGLYLAAEPDTYKRGLVKMVRIPQRPRAREVVDTAGRGLEGWLFAQIFGMTIIGLLSMAGLYLLDIPLWFILGLIAGLLNFIPNIGPIMSGIPPAILALNQSPMQALYVVLFYTALQTVESYLLTPMIQKRAISLPPVLVIMAQVAAGVGLGLMGVTLAAPLLVVVMIMVQMLYLQDVLGDRDVHITGPDAKA